MKMESIKESPKVWRALVVPIIVVFVLAVFMMLIADRFLHHALDMTILNNAEQKALQWNRQVSAENPEIVSLVQGQDLPRSSLDSIQQSATLNNIFRLKVFTPEGRLVFDSALPQLEGVDFDHIDAAQISGVLETGDSISSIEFAEDDPSLPPVYVESYMLAETADGVSYGVIEVYVDVTDINHSMHFIFHSVSRILILGSAIMYLFPALFFVIRREKIRAQDKALMYLSRFDPLTKTLNRREFSQRSEAIFENRGNENVGVIFIDIDRFKQVNDSLGHEFGDSLLEHVARILIACQHPDSVVSRFGGDEFIVLVPATTETELLDFSNFLMESLTDQFTYRGSTVSIGVSIGVHLSPPGEDEARARHSADLALYRAKLNGRGQIVLFSPDLDQILQRRQYVEASMRRALGDRGRFFVEFQPIYRSDGVRPAGFEALMRLQDEEGALIPPAEFIPISEESGLMTEIGELSLYCVLTTTKDWPDDQFIAVNLSVEQFKDGNLIKTVKAALNKTGFNPSRLHFEITESLLIDDEKQVSWQLAELQKLGISISLDDFGTGYSSLGYLWKFRFETLKIDRVFLASFDQSSPKYRQFLSTIITIGKSLDLEVVVEGVETNAQFELLKELNCDYFQGYFLGKPMRADRAVAVAMGQITKKKRA